MQILLRGLPDTVLQAENIDPFLTQLRQQLTFSIPKRNLIVTSSGYQFGSKNLDEKTISVSYFFNADLEDFARVELILRGQGNPQFAPVPVAGR